MSEPTRSDRSGSSPSPTEHDHDHNGDRPPPRKRQRVRLSCLECRRRKLSCDREFPCSRCLQSGVGDRCEYETRPGLAPPNKLGLAQTALSPLDARLSLPIGGGVVAESSSLFRRDSPREADRIRRLELEVAQLKSILSKRAPSLDGSTVNDHSPPIQRPETLPNEDLEFPPFLQQSSGQETNADKQELRFFRGKEFKTRYFGPRSAFLAFSEVRPVSAFPPVFALPPGDAWE